jgi:hypothetical protein
LDKSVAFLTLDYAKGTNPLEPNGCAYYRCWLPMLELEKFGWRVGMGPPEFIPEHKQFGVFFSPERIEIGWDIVVFKLIMLKAVPEILKGPQRPKQKIVVDVDDFYEGLSETNLAYSITDPEKNEEVNRNHYWEIIDNADALITTTQFLYDFYTKEKKFKNVFLVRNGIDVERYIRRKDSAGRLPTIGWVGGVPWRSGDLETMVPFLGEFMQKNRLTFHHSGHIRELKNVDAAKLLGLPSSVKFTNSPRIIISKYPKEMFRRIDIGIVPLNNIPFNHAKSTIKGLEYVSAGVPFVASYSPEYELLESQGIGRIARSPEEWISHLTELLNPKIRKEEAEKNYNNLMLTNTISVRGNDWNNVMNAILDL